MRRVLFISYHFPPVGGAGVQRSLAFVRDLRPLGYSSVVVTGRGGMGERWTPADRTLLEKVPPDTDVRRVASPEPRPSGHWRGRAERWLDLKSEWVRWWIDGAVSLGHDAADDIDVILASLGPYETAEAAAILSEETGKPWVADLQDPWALDEMWLYPTAFHRRRALARMRSLLSSASVVIMNTPEAVRRIRRHFPELADTPVVSIPNGFDASEFEGPRPMRSDGKFWIAHTGYLHTDLGRRVGRSARMRRLLGGMYAPVDILSRSHVFLLEAIERLLAREPALRSKIEVHLAGVTTEGDREVAARSPVARIHGYLPHTEAVRLIRSADLLFLPMHDLPPGLRAGLVPGKTYEYLASGTPILAAVPDGDARELLSDAGNCFLCRPKDVEGMADVIQAQIDRWRSGAPRPLPNPDVVARFERRRHASALASVFAQVAPSANASLARAASS